MPGAEPGEFIWQKSSRSNQQGECVEVAGNLPGVVAVRGPVRVTVFDPEPIAHRACPLLDGSTYVVETSHPVRSRIGRPADPRALFGTPFTDLAPTGPDDLFDAAEVRAITDVLRTVEDAAVPVEKTG